MPNLAHLVGDPLRRPGGGHPGVGDDQHPPHAVLAQVEPDLVGRAGAELQLRRAVGEHRLRVGRERATHRSVCHGAPSQQRDAHPSPWPVWPRRPQRRPCNRLAALPRPWPTRWPDRSGTPPTPAPSSPVGCHDWADRRPRRCGCCLSDLRPAGRLVDAARPLDRRPPRGQAGPRPADHAITAGLCRQPSTSTSRRINVQVNPGESSGTPHGAVTGIGRLGARSDG